ncbi:MAG: hypothetical protein GY755_17550, partial [Chloroflexi bacterium]|nr:hypothetical protein [Chloroflexota bacterium]
TETAVYTGGGSYETIQHTLHINDDLGRPTEVRHSDGTYTETEYGDCCGVKSKTDTRGIKTTYINDDLGRPESVINEATGVTASYTYDTEGRTLTEKVSSEDGTLSLETVSEYDLAGRLEKFTDSAELSTLYDYTSDGLTAKITHPGGGTEITTRYKDGRVESVSGTGVIEQYYEYGVGSGEQWAKIYTGGKDSSMWEKTVTDMTGRTVEIEKTGYGGEIVTTVNEYDKEGKGRLIKTVPEDQAPTLYEYDDAQTGELLLTGLDINNDGDLEKDSEDRIGESETSYEKIGADWWQKTVRKIYAVRNSSTYKETVRMTRVTGLGTAGTDGTLTQETVFFDVSQNETVTKVYTDRDNIIGKSVTDYPDSASDEISRSENGLLKYSQSRTGTEVSYNYDPLGRKEEIIRHRDNNETTLTAVSYNSLGQMQSKLLTLWYSVLYYFIHNLCKIAV